MDFSANNKIVKLCVQAMGLQARGKSEEASQFFSQAWNESRDDFEKFISAHFLAGCQRNISDKLNWLETALQLALKIDDDAVKSAFPSLYARMAKCHEDLRNFEQAKKNYDLAKSCDVTPSDKGPFFHGTKAELQVGDLLRAGKDSNYERELKMNHIYFTAMPAGAGLAAELAKGDSPPRVYVVAPTGPYENDPNVTNSKFPGNPTRSYRSQAPLKIVGLLTEWARQTPAELQKWREKLAASKGKIIN